jgi:small subunit ribosomal protein S16
VAVKIKLKRLGKIREPYYRIVVADARTKRDGRAIEEIGKYHPKAEPSFIEINSERALHWLSVGAQPTDPVRKLLEITGDWQKFKGVPGAEGTLKTASPKADKKDVFAAAVKETLGEEASSGKAGAGRAGTGRRAAGGAHGDTAGTEASGKAQPSGRSRAARSAAAANVGTGDAAGTAGTGEAAEGSGTGEAAESSGTGEAAAGEAAEGVSTTPAASTAVASEAAESGDTGGDASATGEAAGGSAD